MFQIINTINIIGVAEKYLLYEQPQITTNLS